MQAFRIIAKQLRDVGPIAVWVQANNEENLGDVLNVAMTEGDARRDARSMNEHAKATHAESELRYQVSPIPEEVLNNLIADVREGAVDAEAEAAIDLCDMFFEGRIAADDFALLLETADDLGMKVRF